MNLVESRSGNLQIWILLILRSEENLCPPYQALLASQN